MPVARKQASSRMRLAVMAALLGLMTSGLATACSTLATHEEYAAYRTIRMADDDNDRLVALQQYAANHPGGIWASEVAQMRSEQEDTVWATSADTREGLEWYLRVYPDGRYVEQARPRLAALQTVSTRRDEEVERQRELEEQQRQAAIEARRTWVTQAMQFWVRNLLGIRQYGSSLGRVARSNQEFSDAFGNRPEPVCTPDYCIKHYGQTYHIPVPGATRIDRTIDVYLRLVLENGRLRRAELLMPNKGFSRWYEMENHVVVTDEDPEQRMMAINWALDRLQPIIQQAAPAAQQIDFVPEPIDPLQVHGEGGDTDAAPAAPGQEPAAETPAETPAEPAQDPAAETPADVAAEPAAEEPAAEEPAADEGSVIDDLLAQASGTEDPAQAEAPAETPAETPAVDEGSFDTLVLPIGLLSFRHRNLRVVAFAAGDEDYEEAFDGLFFEPMSN